MVKRVGRSAPTALRQMWGRGGIRWAPSLRFDLGGKSEGEIVINRVGCQNKSAPADIQGKKGDKSKGQWRRGHPKERRKTHRKTDARKPGHWVNKGRGVGWRAKS